MTIPQEAQVIQAKLGPKEWDFINALASRRTHFHFEIKAPISRLKDKLANVLRASPSMVNGALQLRSRIIDLAEHFEKAHGQVQLVIDAGAFPQIDLPMVTAPARWLLFDGRQGIYREGWLNLRDSRSYRPMGIIPSGMKIACQSPSVRTYEDWVGMGASHTVLTSLTDRQWNLVKTVDEVAVLERPVPFVPQTPMLVLA